MNQTDWETFDVVALPVKIEARHPAIEKSVCDSWLISF